MSYENIAVYMLASKPHGTLYVGVTSHLVKRVYEHREHVIAGFTKTYGVKQLVYYELHEAMETAIHREKRLKKYSRKAKIKLIESLNPHWIDLWESIIG
jgi:putative endonuclease